MLIYISATCISVCLGYLVQNSKKETKSDKFLIFIFKILTILPLFLVMALRYDVGTDYMHTYRERFIMRLNGRDLSEIFEFGFVKIIDIVIFFTSNPQWLFVVCSIIFFVFTFKAIYEQSDNIAYSILILIIGNHFFGAMNLVRNFMAISIALYAFKYIKERNFLKFTFFIIIASTIHISVLILYPLYFLYNVKLSRKLVVVIIIMVIIGLPILNNMFRYIIKNFTDYYWYYEKNEVIQLNTDIILNSVLLSIQLYYYSKNKRNDKEYNFYIIIELICLCISISSYIVPMIRRLIFIPTFLQILYIPSITKFEKDKKTKFMINLFIIFLFSIVTYKRVSASGMHNVLPYKTFFSKDI